MVHYRIGNGYRPDNVGIQNEWSTGDLIAMDLVGTGIGQVDVAVGVEIITTAGARRSATWTSQTAEKPPIASPRSRRDHTPWKGG